MKRLARELIAMCADVFARRFAMDGRAAQRAAKKLVKQARKHVDGTPLLREPPRRGRRRLEQLRRSAAGQKQLQRLTKEGVRETDFIRWWDHHVLEQEVIRRVDAFEQEQLLEQFTARRVQLAEARNQISRQCPIFGPAGAANHSLGPHTPLPYELRERVFAYLQREDPIELRRGVERCMSLNALIRERIHDGAL